MSEHYPSDNEQEHMPAFDFMPTQMTADILDEAVRNGSTLHDAIFQYAYIGLYAGERMQNGYRTDVWHDEPSMPLPDNLGWTDPAKHDLETPAYVYSHAYYARVVSAPLPQPMHERMQLASIVDGCSTDRIANSLITLGSQVYRLLSDGYHIRMTSPLGAAERLVLDRPRQ